MKTARRDFVALSILSTTLFTGCSQDTPSRDFETVTPVGIASPTPSPSSSPNPQGTFRPAASTGSTAFLVDSQNQSSKLTLTWVVEQPNEVKTITLKNSSAGKTLEHLQLSNLQSGFFKVVRDLCSGSVLSPGQLCVIELSYTNNTQQGQFETLEMTYKTTDGAAALPFLFYLHGPGVEINPSPTPSPSVTPSPSSSPGTAPGSTFQRSTISCGYRPMTDDCRSGTTPSTFDGSNCFVAAAPWGKAFLHQGNFYYSPQAGQNPCASGATFDGSNCWVGKADGYQPFILNNRFYFRPKVRFAATVYAADCPNDTTFDGANCWVAKSPRGTPSIKNNKFVYPATSGTPCLDGDWYDTQACVYRRQYPDWQAFIWDGAYYVSSKNKACVE